MDRESKVIRTLCFNCSSCCPIDVEVRDNRPIKIAGVQEGATHGLLCEKGELVPQWYESVMKGRLMHPMKKADGGWQQITWDEALDTIAERITEVSQRYGPESVLIHVGGMSSCVDSTFYAKWFGLALGTPNFCGINPYCFIPMALADHTTFGEQMVLLPHTMGAKCVVTWGGNIYHSAPIIGRMLGDMMKKQGIPYIVVDPRRSEMAKVATLHIRPRPGTDGALIMGLMNYIIAENLYDKEFVEKWTVGFDELVEEVKKYPLEKVEQITGVPADQIKEFGQIYTTSKPASIARGNAFCGSDNGWQALRASAVLQAITGNIDKPGASILAPTTSFIRIAEEWFPKMGYTMPKAKPIGGPDKHPVWWEMTRESMTPTMVESIISGKPYPIKAILMSRANPIQTGGSVSRWKKALESVEFIVDNNIFFTESSQFADIVLPSACWLEKEEIMVHVGRGWVMCWSKVVEPPEDCWPEWKYWVELAKRLDMEKYLPWQNHLEAQNLILKLGNYGTTAEFLRQNWAGISLGERKFEKHEEAGFTTPSGKVEIYSETLAKAGDSPIPVYREPGESPVSRPDLARHYPLIGVAGLRQFAYYHSMLHACPEARAFSPEPKVEIGVGTGKQYRIDDGDWVIVESPRGEIYMKARVTEDVPDGMVFIDHAWPGISNEALLLDFSVRDPYHGFPNFRPFLCTLKKPELFTH